MARCLWLLLLLTGLVLAAPAPEVEVIAHRGGGTGTVDPDSPPENTVPAFRFGYGTGARACELDCMATADGEIVVIHDHDTGRVTPVDLEVAESTLAELRRLDAGSWKGERWAGVRIPTLDEALATIPEGGRMYVEVKSGPETVPAVAAAIRRSARQPGQIAVISFNHDSAARARELLPDNPVFQLVGFRDELAFFGRGPTPGTMVSRPAVMDNLFALVSEAGLSGLDVNYEGPVDEVAQSSARRGLPWIVWTVNDPAVARDLAELGVSGLTTDLPALMVKTLSGSERVPGR